MQSWCYVFSEPADQFLLFLSEIVAIRISSVHFLNKIGSDR